MTKEEFQKEIFFPIGEENPYGEFFVGQSYLAPVSTEQVAMYNVTFEPGCRNNWHIHHAKNGGGQMLICVGGRGYYQEWGKDAASIGMARLPTHGSHIWRSRSMERKPATNGSKRWTLKVTAN